MGCYGWSMRIYVAGAWVEQHFRARPMMAALRERGVIITHDWSVPEGDVCECGHTRSQHAGSGDRFSLPRDRPVCTVMLPTGCSCVCFNGIGTGSDSKLTSEERRKHASDDLEGVLSADVLWLLAPNTKQSCGAWVELGAALAAHHLRSRLREVADHLRGELQGRPPRPLREGEITPVIVVSGPKWDRAIFTELVHHHFMDDSMALSFIAELQQRSAK